MKINVVYTKKILKDYKTYTFTIGSKNLRRIELGILVLLCVYNFFFAQRNILFSLLYLVALMVLLEVLLRWYTWNKFIKGNMELLNRELTYDFQEEQMHIQSKTLDLIIRYAQVKKVVETNDCFFLYETLQDAYLVDKHQLTSHQQKQVKDYLHNKRVPYQLKKMRYL